MFFATPKAYFVPQLEQVLSEEDCENMSFTGNKFVRLISRILLLAGR
jgi:hypothetical protein